MPNFVAFLTVKLKFHSKLLDDLQKRFKLIFKKNVCFLTVGFHFETMKPLPPHNTKDSVNPRGGGTNGSTFDGYTFVLLASQSPDPSKVYSVTSYRPHLSHFCENANFAIPT